MVSSVLASPSEPFVDNMTDADRKHRWESHHRSANRDLHATFEVGKLGRKGNNVRNKLMQTPDISHYAHSPLLTLLQHP